MISLDEIRSRLRVNKHRLDDELEVQAEIQERLAMHRSELERSAAQAKEALSRLEATLLLEYKSTYDKCNEAQIKALINSNQERRDSWDAAHRARFAADEVAELLEAWKQRSYSMRSLADLYTSNYFAPRSLSAPDTTPETLVHRRPRRV